MNTTQITFALSSAPNKTTSLDFNKYMSIKGLTSKLVSHFKLPPEGAAYLTHEGNYLDPK